MLVDDDKIDTSLFPIMADSIGNWTYDMTTSMSDGTYSVSIEAIPVGGTVPERSDALKLTIDAVEDSVRAFWNDSFYIIDALGRQDIGPGVNAMALKDGSGRPLSDASSRSWNAIGVMKPLDSNNGGYRMLQISERGRRSGRYRIAELSADGVLQSWDGWVTPTQAAASGYEELFGMDLNGDGLTGIPLRDDDGDGFVDGADYYAFYIDENTKILNTNYLGNAFAKSDFKGLKAISTDTGFDILEQGTQRRTLSSYRIRTADNNGQHQTIGMWKKGDALVREGVEDLFGIDLNQDELIGTPLAIDLDGNGLVDGIANYALFKQGTDPEPDSFVELTSPRGGFYSDDSSRRWNVIHAAEVGSEFKLLLQGERGRRRSQYKVWTANSEGQVAGTSGWLQPDQLVSDGYESIFGLDLNNNGAVGN